MVKEPAKDKSHKSAKAGPKSDASGKRGRDSGAQTVNVRVRDGAHEKERVKEAGASKGGRNVAAPKKGAAGKSEAQDKSQSKSKGKGKDKADGSGAKAHVTDKGVKSGRGGAAVDGAAAKSLDGKSRAESRKRDDPSPDARVEMREVKRSRLEVSPTHVIEGRTRLRKRE